jgi:putative transposase
MLLARAARHERMHLTLKKETAKPAASNFLQQQAKFDAFIDSLQQPTPARSPGHEVSGRSLSALSTGPYLGLPDIDYPFHDKVVVVTNCGRICFRRKD